MNQRIVLIIPSLNYGGMERVMTVLANSIIKKNELSVYLIVLTKGIVNYSLDSKVKLIEPTFERKHFTRLSYTIRTFHFLRSQLKGIRPKAILSFGGKYNSFVLLASLGLKLRTFISDRSRPTISYGFLMDKLNVLMYRYADGIIAQTSLAKEVLSSRFNHKNIQVIGNPIKVVNSDGESRIKIILNVGRFIRSKNQDKLVSYFSQLSAQDWKLFFLGDGEYLPYCRLAASDLGIINVVTFFGNVGEIEPHYIGASIFAFTSTSEGFPNALAEAMAAGCACISFDCVAGPSDLIDDGVNGFLIPLGNDAEYIQKLQLLIDNPELRARFGSAAKKKMEKFSVDIIAEEYLNFMLS